MGGGKLATHCQGRGVSLEESGHRSTLVRRLVWYWQRFGFSLYDRRNKQICRPLQGTTLLAANEEAYSSGLKLVNNPG